MSKVQLAKSYSQPKLTRYEVDGNEFLLPSHYVPIGVVGSGAYGKVVSAWDTRTTTKVAIKKITNVFEHGEEYQKRILREILVLRHFRGHENVIELKDLVLPENFETFADIYVVTNLMDFDLKGIIKSNQELFDDNIQYFLYQILRGLKYLHSADVLHRDLKPSNILLNADMDVSLCDFGLSRGVDFKTDPTMSTTYVATRWYRAPELLLLWEKTSKALDIWSIGCIFAELLSEPGKRKPLFPGEHYLDQLKKIINVVGSPVDIENVKACPKAKVYLKSMPEVPKTNLSTLFPKASELALDLLEKLLEFDPEKRISVEDALKHPYLKDLHDPDDEPTCKKFDFQFTNQLKGKSNVKKMMYDIIVEWNKEQNHVCGDAVVAEGVVKI